ncbi:hypothetical protein EB001_23635 [bacterium]|nr:hypothetical protein [bacterium]
MFSYLFSASKKPVADTVPESVPEPVQNTLESDNEQLKAQIQTLLTENAKLQKQVEYLKRDSEVYRDLMFTKTCNCR